MDEVISTVVANGIWATLFVFLLVFELRDSRKREARYTATIKSLSDRLSVVCDIKQDTDELISEAKDIKSDTARLLADGKKRAGKGGAPCSATT